MLFMSLRRSAIKDVNDQACHLDWEMGGMQICFSVFGHFWWFFKVKGIYLLFVENRQNYIDILCLIQIDMHVFWSNKPQNYVDIYNAWLAVWYYLDTWCKSKWHHGNICTFLGFSPVHRSVQKRRRKNVSFEPKIGTI